MGGGLGLEHKAQREWRVRMAARRPKGSGCGPGAGEEVWGSPATEGWCWEAGRQADAMIRFATKSCLGLQRAKAGTGAPSGCCGLSTWTRLLADGQGQGQRSDRREGSEGAQTQGRRRLAEDRGPWGCHLWPFSGRSLSGKSHNCRLSLSGHDLLAVSPALLSDTSSHVPFCQVLCEVGLGRSPSPG